MSARIAAHAGRPTLAIDGGILIAGPEDLRGWRSAEQIRFSYSPGRKHPYSPPPMEEIERKVGPIRHPQWNEDKFCILDWSMDRGNLRLDLGATDTVNNTAIEATAHHPLMVFGGERMTLTEAYARGVENFMRHLPNTLTVNCVVVTADEKALAVRRGDHLHYSPGHWEISISEQMNAAEPEDRDFLFFGAIRRCLLEELGVRDIREIVVTGLVREVVNLNINATALVRVDMSAQQVAESLAHAEDGDEHGHVEFFDWSLETACTRLFREIYLSSADDALSGRYVPAGRIRLLMAMLAEFGPQPVLDCLHAAQAASRTR